MGHLQKAYIEELIRENKELKSKLNQLEYDKIYVQ